MTLLERRCRWLSESMADARCRADANPESSCWEELEAILADMKARLGQRQPDSYRPSSVPPPAGTCSHDIEFGLAIRAAHRELVT
jgi:hypothetical protein